MADAMHRLAARLRSKTAAPHALSLQLNAQIPGTPLSLRGGEVKEERLPGMRRWVDREMLQRAYRGLADGESASDLIEEEGARGSVMHPLIGAAASAAAAAHYKPDLAKLIPALGANGPLAAILAAALGGGVAGGLFHGYTRGSRERDMREAIQGVRKDMAANPRPKDHAIPTGQKDQGTASAATPTLLATAPSNW